MFLICLHGALSAWEELWSLMLIDVCISYVHLVCMVWYVFFLCVCTRSCDGEWSTSVCMHVHINMHSMLVGWWWSRKPPTLMASYVLLCVGVDRCSISIQQRGVLYIYSICSSKHLSLVLCRYMSLFMRACVSSVLICMCVDARRWIGFVPC